MHLPESFKNQSSSVQSLSHVRLFVTPWIAARQASLSITNSQSLLKLMSIESVMPSNHLILCCPLLLLPPIPPSISIFSNESTLHMRWPSTGVPASVSVHPMNTQDWSPLGCTGWISLQSKGLSVLSNTNLSECVTVNLWQLREKVTMRSRHLKKENLRPHDVQGKKSHKSTLFFKTILPIAFLLKKTSWTALPNCDKHLTFNWLLGLPSPERWLSLQFDQQSP